MPKKVFITVARHPQKGPVLVLQNRGLTELADETKTNPDEWKILSGWLDYETALATGPAVERAVREGLLQVVEVDD